MQEIICPISGARDCEVFLSVPGVPLFCNVLYDTPDEAIAAPRGDMELAFCRTSGHVFNAAFRSELMEYSQVYENSLHFSPKFHEFATRLADRLIDTYDIRGKRVIDIGCGKGDFLGLLCDRGDNVGLGFDPSFEGAAVDAGGERKFEVVRDLYSQKYADRSADLICCRHVLEHIERPVEFMRAVRATIGDDLDTAVYFEVPNVMFILRDLAAWDIIYEHVGYFSSYSLSSLFAATGFDVLDVYPEFGGQYLGIEARPAADADAPRSAEMRADTNPAQLGRDVISFKERYRAKVADWQDLIDRIGSAGKSAVIWGAGSKGVTILNTLGVTDVVDRAVDINPRKQGRYIAGTGQQIVAPERLRDSPPDFILLMNAIYEEEVREMVATLGLEPEFIVA